MVRDEREKIFGRQPAAAAVVVVGVVVVETPSSLFSLSLSETYRLDLERDSLAREGLLVVHLA